MKQLDHDLFNVTGRLQQIDPAYTIWRNEELARFEVHWRGKLAFVVPFQELDARTVFYTKKTRRENADDLEREIDEGNQQIMLAREQKLQQLKTKIKDYVQYEYDRFN